MKEQLGWTDIEQSKKLVETGLNPYTADMNYRYCICRCVDGEPIEDWLLGIGKLFDECPDEQIPCWSLGRLLEIIPHFVIVEGIECQLHICPNGIGEWEVDYSDLNNDYTPFSYSDKSLLDALFYTICSLSEHGYITERREQ